MENTVTISLEEYKQLEFLANRYKNIEKDFNTLLYKRSHTIFIEFLYKLQTFNIPIKIKFKGKDSVDLSLFDLNREYEIIDAFNFYIEDPSIAKLKNGVVFELQQKETKISIKELLKKYNEK